MPTVPRRSLSLLILISRAAVFALLLAGAALHAATMPVPAPPAVDARSYLLIDFNSGVVLAQSNVDERVEPASITKIMTAYVVYQALKQNTISAQDEVTVSEKAWRSIGSRMFLDVGTQVSLENLLLGMIVQSGNDASVALAEHVAGTEQAFAGLMNNFARHLGMTNTNYVNATGLPDPEHYTTARDIATLTRALIRDFAEQYGRYSIKEFTYNGISQHNRNKLLWRDNGVDGVKTGYTESAGYCLVTSAARNHMRLIAVVLGAASEDARAAHNQALLNYGYQFYETHQLYSAAKPLSNSRVWKGDVDTLDVGLANDLYVTIPRGRYKSLSAALELSKLLEAPIDKGQRLGTVRVMIGDKSLTDAPLVALQTVSEGGMLRVLMDSVLQYFR
ncbi:MAG: D-alanyl-D-alanine carboxypeptidase family protein [Gammaproteobacteria bacterium]